MKRTSIKKWNFIGIILLVVSLVTVLLFQKSLLAFAEKRVASKEPVQIETPTIMVPGTNGTVNRFDDLIDEVGTTGVLKVTVQTDGTVTSTGKLTTTTTHPIIVIGFEDSSDETLDKQGEWYQLALHYIQQSYTFAAYNYFGHSNGGLVITSYLENYQAASDPELIKLITLGTPYNDTSDQYNETGTKLTEIKETSSLLQGYLTNIARIPSTIQMLNIAGEIDQTSSDGIVPVTSVLAGRLIYAQSLASSYQEVLLTGDQTGHSDLVENKQMIQQMMNFFWPAE